MLETAFSSPKASATRTRRRTCVKPWLHGSSGLLVDPLGFDAGDSNLYRYVSNKPTIAIDPRGLEWVNSGVGIALTYGGGFPFTEFGVRHFHSFLVIDGKGYGRIEVNTNAIGTAKIRNGDEFTVYPNDKKRSEIYNKYMDRNTGPGIFGRITRARELEEAGFMATKDSPYYSVVYDFYIDDSLYDPKEFKKAIREYIKAEVKDPGNYIVVIRDCDTFVDDGISYALSKSDIGSWWDHLWTSWRWNGLGDFILKK